MAGIPTDTMSYWRSFFASANNFSVFDILDRAITVAAYDYPTEFRRQKDPIINMIQELGHGEASETESDQALSKTPSLKLPSGKIRIKIKQHSLIKKPCVDEAKPCSGEAKEIKRPCHNEAKLIMKPKPGLDEDAIEAKLQDTKRKLHDQYDDIEKAKRQRRVQVLDYVPKLEEFKNGISLKRVVKKHCIQKSQRNRLVGAIH